MELTKVKKEQIFKKVVIASILSFIIGWIFWLFQVLILNVFTYETIGLSIEVSNGMLYWYEPNVNWLLYWILWFWGFLFFSSSLIGFYYSFQFKNKDLNKVEMKSLNIPIFLTSWFFYFNTNKSKTKFGESRFVKIPNNTREKTISNKKNGIYKLIAIASLLIYFVIFSSILFVVSYFLMNPEVVASKNINSIIFSNNNENLLVVKTSFEIGISFILMIFGSFSIVGMLGMVMEFLLINRDYKEEFIVGIFFGVIIVGLLQLTSYKIYKKN